MPIHSIDPTTGKTLEEFEPLDEREVGERIDRAARAWAVLRRTALEKRLEWLRAAAAILDEERDRWAGLMVREMGKPISQARAEAEKCAWVCRYYAEHAPGFLADEPVEAGEGRAWIRYEPIGPVLAVMPWNFPFWQVFRFAAPALAAGNVALLKHASSVPRCALAIEEIFRRAGVPDGGFQALLAQPDVVPAILADPRVRAATLTGSEAAGSSVAAEAGRNLKKTVLELGGSDPFIVMPSADVDLAAETGVRARTINNGQSCIAAKRFIVHREVYDRWLERFVEGFLRLQVGDPMDPAVDIGPLATERGRDDLAGQVARSVEAGARVACGGSAPDRPGFFFEPTVLTDVPEDAPARSEELFGPVATVFRVDDLDEALALANDSDFGLGASVWTSDRAEVDRFVAELDAGMVFVNQMVASDPRLPFGGVKRSGYGRELGIHGIREFVNAKTVRTAGR
jgi:succinate-semialdehyde dehydrogenase / glutarate-semialdehyde dehydrogenase